MGILREGRRGGGGKKVRGEKYIKTMDNNNKIIVIKFQALRIQR